MSRHANLGFALWTAAIVVAVIVAEVAIALSYTGGPFLPSKGALGVMTFLFGLVVWAVGLFVFVIAAALGIYVVEIAARAGRVIRTRRDS